MTGENRARSSEQGGRGQGSEPASGDPDAVTSPTEPPYVPSHEAHSEIQEEHAGDRPIPLMPANAAGADKVSVDDQSHPVDEASMYEGRPAPEYDQLRRRP